MDREGALYGSLLALSGAILFSTKAVLVKLAYHYDVTSTSLLMLRMLFAFPIFLMIGLRSLNKAPQDIKILVENRWSLLLFGMTGYYIASILDLEGLKYIDASLERVIIFMYPTLVVILSYLWLGQKINSKQIFAIVICYAGIVLAYLGNVKVSSSPNTLHGSLLVLGSSLTYTVYLVGSQKMVARMSSRLYNSVAMCIAAIAIIIHNALVNGFNLFDFQLEIYLYALLIATISTVIPSFMIVEGIRIIGANNSSIIGSIGPISTIIMASILLQEQIGLVQWAGTIIVISGVLYLILSRKKAVHNR